MIATRELNPEQKSAWLKSNHLARVIKLAAVTLAIVYSVNGSVIAADYANSPRLAKADFGARVASTVWMGVAWPAVVHNKMTTEPMQRLGPLPQVSS